MDNVEKEKVYGVLAFAMAIGLGVAIGLAVAHFFLISPFS